MLARIASALVGIAVGAAPAAGQLEHLPSRPLKIVCSSITMDYCVNVWSYDWWISRVFDDGFTHANQLVVEPFGSGFETAPRVLWYESLHVFADGRASGLNGYTRPLESQPGMYVMNDLTGHGSPTVETQPVTPPSFDDVYNLGFGLQEFCDPGLTCYEVPFEVPEPLSGLLLGTGLLGVAVARRRRASGSASPSPMGPLDCSLAGSAGVAKR